MSNSDIGLALVVLGVWAAREYIHQLWTRFKRRWHV